MSSSSTVIYDTGSGFPKVGDFVKSEYDIIFKVDEIDENIYGSPGCRFVSLLEVGEDVVSPGPDVFIFPCRVKYL